MLYASTPSFESKQKFVSMKRAIRDITAGDRTKELCRAGGVNLVYGYGEFENAIVLDFPDGGYYQVDRLIHHTHPRSPEELYLREYRVEAREIFRFHIPGLDDTEWSAQERSRGSLDEFGLRTLLATRPQTLGRAPIKRLDTAGERFYPG
jgi:hypothetical protein